MSTIKDVARRAGVSVGSVSNVLNGKTKNKILIDQVEAAIKELNFKPDERARSLKNPNSKLIGLITGSMEDLNLIKINASIERELRLTGYTLVVKSSDNNPILEQKCFEYFVQLGVDGIIINTRAKRNLNKKELNSGNIPVVYTEQISSLEKNTEIITVDYTNAFEDCFWWCIEQNLKKVAIIIGNGIIKDEQLQEIGNKSEVEYLIYKVSDYSLESGFRAAYEILYDNSDIDTIILGSSQLAEGAKKAIEVFDLHPCKIRQICIKAKNWIEDEGNYDGIIEASNYEIGQLSARTLVERIEKNQRKRTGVMEVEAEFKVIDQVYYKKTSMFSKKTHELNIAMIDAESALALEKLSKIYEEENGVQINFRRYTYQELWELVSNKEKLKEKKIDLFMFDLIWKDALAKKENMINLTKLKEDPEYFDGFIEDIVENYGEVDGKLYGLPLITGTQLLFYQRDLFEDKAMKLRFQREYEYDLQLPTDWKEFNDICRFFTREYSDFSPVKYGTAIINTGNLYNGIELLNRLWSFGGNIMEEGKDSWNESALMIAMESYRETSIYTDKNKEINNWEDIAAYFRAGDTAMVVLYDSYASGINDLRRSNVAGNIGSSVIPGGSPVLGGWSIALSATTENESLSEDFLKWACSSRVAQPFSVLSGVSSRKDFYMNKDLEGLYPWKEDVLTSYAISRPRKSIYQGGDIPSTYQFYEDVLGKTLGQCLRGDLTIEESIEKIKKNTEKILTMRQKA